MMFKGCCMKSQNFLLKTDGRKHVMQPIKVFLPSIAPYIRRGFFASRFNLRMLSRSLASWCQFSSCRICSSPYAWAALSKLWSLNGCKVSSSNNRLPCSNGRSTPTMPANRSSSALIPLGRNPSFSSNGHTPCLQSGNIHNPVHSGLDQIGF